jgi:hypothetical protein
MAIHYPYVPIPSYTKARIHPLSLPPHSLQVLDNREVRIQKPVHAVLRTALLSLLQLAALNRPGHAFLPADIGQGMHRYITTVVSKALSEATLQDMTIASRQ